MPVGPAIAPAMMNETIGGIRSARQDEDQDQRDRVGQNQFGQGRVRGHASV